MRINHYILVKLVKIARYHLYQVPSVTFLEKKNGRLGGIKSRGDEVFKHFLKGILLQSTKKFVS